MNATKIRSNVIITILAVLATVITLSTIEAIFSVTVPGEVWALMGLIAGIAKDIVNHDEKT